jgi:hemerythrin-like domain-containing protein
VYRDPSLVPLSHQHHNGLALSVLTERSMRSDPSEANLRRLADRIIDRYELELVNHFELEEQILFPALSHVPLTSELIAEHRTMAAYVHRMRACADADTLASFTALLRHHIRREENELFEIAQKELPREKLDEMGREFEARAVRMCLS